MLLHGGMLHRAAVGHVDDTWIFEFATLRWKQFEQPNGGPSVYLISHIVCVSCPAQRRVIGTAPR